MIRSFHPRSDSNCQYLERLRGGIIELGVCGRMTLKRRPALSRVEPETELAGIPQEDEKRPVWKTGLKNFKLE